MTTTRRLSAATGLGLAAAAAVAAAVAPIAPAAAGATEPADACSGVTVAVDFNQLGGGEQLVCVDHGGSAEKLFADAGFELGYQPGMQDFVCTVDGLPDDGDCTTGSRYWSLWWSPGTKGWSYATLGVRSLDVARGDSLAFTWHQGDGKAEPPQLDVGAATAADHKAPPPTSHEDGSSAGTWAAVGLGVVVLGAAAAVPLWRRRRTEP